MSADNWAICPRCLHFAEAQKTALEKKANAAYGKIGVAQYLALKEKAEKPIDKEILRTFREDFELGMSSDGQFAVSYSGSCQCGFKYSFKHEQQIEATNEKR